MPLKITYMLKCSTSLLPFYCFLSKSISTAQVYNQLLFYKETTGSCLKNSVLDSESHPSKLYLQPAVLLLGYIESNNLELPGSS